MKLRIQILIALTGVLMIFGNACQNEVSVDPTPPLPPDTLGHLKSEAKFPIGIGVDADLMLNNSTYFTIVKRQFGIVTPEHVMKQTVTVQNDGSFNYSKPDQLVQVAKNAGLDVHGHTLIWHKANNGNYLRTLVSGGSGGGLGPNLAENGGLEFWNNSVPGGWTVINNTNGSFSKATRSVNIHSGDNALKVSVSSASDAWKTQILTAEMNTTPGATYRVSFWIKANASGGKYQIEWRTGPATVKYSGTKNTSTSYTLKTFTFEANASTSSIAFDMGAAANTYFIDELSVREVGGGKPQGPVNILDNGGFESWSNSVPGGWTVINNTNGSFSKATMSRNVHGGNNALKVSVSSASDAWKTQILSPEFNTKVGDMYKVTFWIKANSSGGKYQLEGRSGPGNVKYSGTKNTSTSYTLKTFTFEAQASSSAIAFDMGAAANTYFIDDIKVKNISKGTGGGGNTGVQDSIAVVNFMKTYITQTVSHYKGKVKSWDVVNEPFNAAGELRTNVSGAPTTGDIFYWGQYVGPGYIPLAFKYAHQADQNAILYINEYNLESNSAKLNALIDLVNKMKSNAIPIDGIGTEMHISLNTSYAGISRMFKKLASTGLLVRVSELDVKINPNDNPNFKPTHQFLSYQRIMYNYVVWAYMKYVPKDQRGGIAVWNLTDKHSWIVDQGHNDYPTLFDKNYHKKPAFSGFMRGLKGYAPAGNKKSKSVEE